MWQSNVEIEDYSVVYLITLPCLKRCTTELKGRAHTCSVDVLISSESTKYISASPLTEVQ